MKIAMCGAHGVGKTTFAASLADSLELPVLPTPGRWMAERGLPINEEATVASQVLAWLLQQRFEAEQPAWISSRSVVDVWAYASLAAAREAAPVAQELFAALTTVTRVELRGRYTVLLYVPPRIKLRADHVRVDDEQFQRATDEQIRAGLADFAVPYEEVDVGDARSRSNVLSDLRRLRERERSGRRDVQ